MTVYHTKNFGLAIERRSVSIPGDLDRRMRLVGHAINWSATACEAFEQALRDLAEREAVEDKP